MSDIPNLATALYPGLRSEADAAPEARPEAGSEPASLAEKIYGTEPVDANEKRRAGIEAGIAKPIAEIAADAANEGEAVGAFGLPSGALTNEFSALIKETGLSEASASRMANLHRKAQTETSTRYWDTQSRNWETQTRRQFGAQFDATVASVRPLINDRNLTTPGFRALLDEYRLGNHPDVVRTLANWARAMRRR